MKVVILVFRCISAALFVPMMICVFLRVWVAALFIAGVMMLIDSTLAWSTGNYYPLFQPWRNPYWTRRDRPVMYWILTVWTSICLVGVFAAGITLAVVNSETNEMRTGQKQPRRSYPQSHHQFDDRPWHN